MLFNDQDILSVPFIQTIKVGSKEIEMSNKDKHKVEVKMEKSESERKLDVDTAYDDSRLPT